MTLLTILLTFTTTNTIPNVNEGTVTVTYPAGTNYNITMSPVMGLDGYCDPINITGTAPICCTPPTCSINGPDAAYPGATSQHCAPANLSAYAWSIEGDGVINGDSNQQCVEVTASGACNTTYTLTLVAGTNPCASTCTKTVTVEDNTAPSLTCPSNTTVECPSIPSFGVPTATDDCGNTATCSSTISVQDITPPVVTCPGNLALSCAANVPLPDVGLVAATDACGVSTVTSYLGEVVNDKICENRFSVTRRYAARDLCGNSSTCTQLSMEPYIFR